MSRSASWSLLSALALIGGAGPLAALDNYIVGPRAQGMGGTGVASSDDYTAQYYNPALFGFFGSAAGPDNQGLAGKRWGVGFDASAGARIHGSLLDIAETLADADIQGLSDDGIESREDIRELLAAARALTQVGASGNAVSADANAGVSVRFGHGAIGVRLFGQAATLVSNTDLQSVALDVAGAVLGQEIADHGENDSQVLLLSDAQRDNLYAAFGGNGSFGTDAGATEAVLNLDYEMRQLGISQGQVQAVVEVVQNAAEADPGTPRLEDNDTILRLRAFALAEVPLSYGWAIGDHWSVGGSLKLMIGRVYGTELSVFDEDAPIRFDKTVDNYETTTTWGIDLAVAGRWDWIQVGAVGRNLNSPEFDGFTNAYGAKVAGVRVDPQVAVGVAVIPYRWLTVALDADLLEGESSFPGYDTQRIGGGLEVNPWNILALRAGVYQNVAESDIGPVITLGAGLNLWAMRIDLGVASSTDLTTLKDYDVPDEMRLSLGLTADF
jgi:hypothetical protein